MSMLKKFEIIGLWGERNYHLTVDDGKLIMIGGNGCGKSTVLRIIYYTLTKKWLQLMKEDFERIEIVIGDERKALTKEQLEGASEYLLLEAEMQSNVSAYREKIYSNVYKKRFVDREIQDILEKNLRSEEMEKIKKRMSTSIVPIKKVSEWITEKFDEPILYLPTYRRSEKKPEIQERESEYTNNTSYSKHKTRSTKMEVSHVGMKDVDKAIYNLIDEIKLQYAKSASQLNLDCFRGILRDDFKKVDSIREEYMVPESIEMIFESLDEKEFLDVDKKQIKEKLLSIIEKTESYDEYDKIVIYYYNMLIRRYENLKAIEERLEYFFYICNQYLDGKQFVYKPKMFKYFIMVESRTGTLKEMDIEQLSSGEKQIVALFSYIYLGVEQPCTIIIDEPELSLSVTWQERILEDITKSEKCSQLIVATQSPFVYDNSLFKYAHAMEEFLGVE